MDKFWFVFVIVLAYLLGNISPSTMLAKAVGMDIKKEGSGNAGTTNALRVLGKKAAVVTLLIDILKGVVAVEIGFLLSTPMAAYICCLVAFIGHCFPALLKFKGGKGVATAFGGLLAVNWQLALLALGIVVVVVLFTRMVSLGSIITAACFPITSYFLERDFFWIGIIMAIILIYNHRANLVRIIHGEESKLGSKK